MSNNNYKIYELVDMNRGGIYQDFTDDQEIRKSWWALQPHSVDDRYGDINEDFVNFVEARENHMIRRPIFNLLSLTEEFNKTINNLDEYINKVNDKKKFFENLVKLQKYITKQGGLGDKYLKTTTNPSEMRSMIKECPEMNRVWKIVDINEKKPIYIFLLSQINNNGGEGVVEDGSAKFSTDSAMGQDEFPAYNNKNTEPSIRNNLDANSALYKEDLEYKHVDNATEDEYVLSEEQLEDFHAYDESFDVYKNPKSIKRMVSDLRGLLDAYGNLYVIDDSWSVIHNVFAEWLNSNGYPVAPNTYYNLNVTVPLQRYKDTNNFYLSESLTEDEIEDNIEDITTIVKKGKEKNPQYNFILKNIGYAEPNIDQPLSEERKKAWIPGSKAVTVKKKCRLGGLGNTSAACNQGDINNLEFTSLNEVRLDDIKGHEFYKNPPTIKNLAPDARGFIDTQGNLYIVDDSYNLTHGHIMGELMKLNIVSPQNVFNYTNSNIGLAVQRIGNTNYLALSDAYSNASEIFEKSKNIINNFNKKNPRVKIIGMRHVDASESNIEALKKDNVFITEEVKLDQGFVQGWNRYDILHNGEVAGEIEVSNRNKYMILNKIFIKPEHRGMGHADDAMKLLIDHADQNNKIIALTPDSVWGANKEKLKKWYKSLGFVMNKGRNADYQVREMMVRYPKNGVDEGVGDKYLEKKHGIPSEFSDFEKRYKKERLSGEIVYEESDGWGIVKNPDSLKNIGPDVRGIITENGDFYIETFSKNIHQQIVNFLIKKGILHTPFIDSLENPFPKEYLSVQRYGDTNKILVGESNDAMQDDKYMYDGWRKAFGVPSKEEAEPYFQKFIDAAKRKNPNIDFINEHISVYKRNVHGINENQINENLEDISYSQTYWVSPDNKIVGNDHLHGIQLIYPELRGVYGSELEDKRNKYYIKAYNDGYSRIRIDGMGFHNNKDEGCMLNIDAPNEKRFKELLKKEYPCVLKDKSSVYFHIIKEKLYGRFTPDDKRDLYKYLFFNVKPPQMKSASNSNLNESEIMSLQDLPFKKKVENLGGKIYSVGGAVRDEFLGKESKDLDILITGIPFNDLAEIMKPYGKVDAVGKSFGVLKFKPQGATEEIDVAIPRTEKPTGEKGHKGFDVTSDHVLPIEDDLRRRDFTINAIAKDIDGNIIDPFGGQEDLKNKIIRMTNPEAFSDDPLRMLRAIQFSSRFNFEIEPQTMEMIKKNAHRVDEISSERILTEFDKIVKKGDISKGVQLLKDTGLFKNIFGYDIKQSTIDRSPWDDVKTMGEFIYLLTRLTPQPAEIYKNKLKGDIPTYKEIKALDYGMNNVSDVPMNNRKVANEMYKISPKSLESKVLPQKLEQATQELLRNKFPKTVGELAVNGNDLMQAGLKGKEIGDKLESLLINIYAEKVRNNREELLDLLNKNTPESS